MIRSLHRSLVWLVLLPVVFYRRWLSPMKRLPTCNFEPTCSQYALDAVKQRGIVVGIALASWRIVRCNPFMHGGFDPVPCRHAKDTGALSAQEQH